MSKEFKYLPQNKRKKILIICDDIRVYSGVATVAKEIILKTSQHFNWINLAGAITHPELNKRLDLSNDINKETGLNDALCIQYPTSGYGNPQFLRQIMSMEKPDAIMLITDPRYFNWVFNMEHEIRKNIPIIYLNIWDDYPTPMYNSAFYEACDLLLGISKQTVNINKLVLEGNKKDRIFKYLPHGLDENIYKPIDENDKGFNKFKKEIFKNTYFENNLPEFIVFFNSRNIRRKQIPDTMLAFRVFLDSLPKEKSKKCCLILHTELVTDPGTDLEKVREYLFEEEYSNNVIFSLNKMPSKTLNYLYNLADVQVLITSNEGWGLTLTEAMLSGTPIIANTTGGMQDQMRFVDEKGKWFTPSKNIPSNHRGTYKKHGEWAFPVYPTSRSIQGSPPTPYIYDDRCKWEDVTERFKELYKMGKNERKKRGLKGREWAMSKEAGFTAEIQGQRIIENFDELFDKWKPREKYELINANEYRGKFLNHSLIY